jgi:lipoprotein-releasing system permease protein
MNSWSVARRLMHYEKGSFVVFIIRLAYLSTALSMAIMIIAFAVIAGFDTEISRKIFGFWGHIQVNSIHSAQLNVTEPIDYNPALVQALDSIQPIKHIQSFAFMPAVMTAAGEMDGIILKGIGADFGWKDFQPFLKEGHGFESIDSSHRQLLISQSIAARMNLKIGDACRLHFVIDEQVIPRQFTVSGIYSTGLEEYDQKLALIDLRQIQALNQWDSNQIGGYEIFLRDIHQVDLVANEIYDHHLSSDEYVETIRQKFPSIFDWLQLQSTNQYVVLLLMLAVAIINIITVLLILILERTKMIGILKALGSTNRLLKRIFVMHGMAILLKGLIWGNIIGLAACLIQKYGKIIKLNEADYYLTIAPISFRPEVFLFLNLGTIVLTMLFLIIPAILISRISPIKAIGYR